MHEDSKEGENDIAFEEKNSSIFFEKTIGQQTYIKMCVCVYILETHCVCVCVYTYILIYVGQLKFFFSNFPTLRIR